MVIASETFVTNFAFERLFTGVSAFVVLQDVLVAEATIARFASEDFVLAVVVGGRGRRAVAVGSRPRALRSD